MTMDLVKLLSRGKVADTLLKELREKVARLRQQVAAAEVQRLTRENEELTLQCEAWRQRLIKAEIANGKKQYPLPTRCVSSDAAAAGDSPKTAGVAEQQQSGDSAVKEQPPTDGKKAAKKAAKESKPQAAPAEKDNKSKAQPAEKVSDAVCVSQLDLRVGLIKQVDRHPDADALYLEQIDLGEEKPRTVLSGLVKFVPMEQMRDRLVVVMCNLKPAKMRGILSEGMIMCASTPEAVEPIRPPPNAVPGDRVVWTGLPAESYPAPETVLNPKKKIWERIAPDLKVDEQGNAVWMCKKLEVRGKGPLTADTLKNVNVK